MRQHDRHSRFSRTTWAWVSFVLLGASAVAQTAKLQSVPDAQIEANVLKALAGASQLVNEHVSTSTVFGTVTLSGSVSTEAARTMAEKLASETAGVKKVVDELTLGDAPATAGQADPGREANANSQSNGTMAPPSAQSQAHAPDPDVYAAQHGMTDTPQDQQQGTQQNNVGNYNPPPPPSYRQPYNGQQPPYNQQPQGYSPNQQPSYPPQAQGGYAGQQTPPAPYGAQQAGLPVTVPSGALLRVRINEGLDTKHSQPGTPFDAVILNDVVAEGAVAIPRGASVQGKVTEVRNGGTLAGHGEIALQLTQVTLGGKTFPIASDIWSRSGDGKGGQTAANAIGLGATGAIIGAIAGGGPGAAIGAGIGGVAGLGTSAASGSRQVIIPSEAILTFHLAQPAPMTTISQVEMDRLSYGVPVGAQPPQELRRRYAYPRPYYGPVYYPRAYGYPYPY